MRVETARQAVKAGAREVMTMPVQLRDDRRLPNDETTYSLPVRLSVGGDGVYSPRVTVLPEGRVEVVWMGWGMMAHALNDCVRREIAAHWQSLMPHYDYYWRGTNNIKEISLLRKGELHPSINHADQTRERGLSVADHLGYVMVSGYKYGYRVRGNVIGHGSDGEPLLDVATAKALDRRPRPLDDIRAKEHQDYIVALAQVIAAAGWTEEQYRAALWAYCVPADRYDCDCWQ